MVTRGSADLERLVDICIHELHYNPRLHLVDTMGIHEVVRTEVLLSRSPLYQQLVQIFAGHPAALFEGLLAQGLLNQSLQRLNPGGNIRRQSPDLAFQGNFTDIKDAVAGQPQPPLIKQEQSVPSEMHDDRANQELAEPRSPNGKLSAPKAPTLIVAPRPPAKPLLPGGPCENPFCGVVEAPQWRRIDKKLVCNRCGMYWHRHAQFPDASYFSGLASKQAVKHIVVMHRSRQDASPSGSSPAMPQPQELDNCAAETQPRTQSPTQLQVREIAGTSSARSHETDSHGGGSTNTSTTNNNLLNVTNNGTGGPSGVPKADNMKEKASDVNNNTACGGRQVAPPLSKEVLLKVITGQCDHMDTAAIRKAQFILKHMQQEQQQQQQLQMLQQLQQHAQQQWLTQRTLGLNESSVMAASQPAPERTHVSLEGPVARAPAASQEAQSISTHRDPPGVARNRLRLQSQSQLPLSPPQQQEQRAIRKQPAGISEIELDTLRQGRNLASRDALGSAQPKASSRDGNLIQQHPKPLPLMHAVNLVSATGGSCKALQQELSGNLLHIQSRGGGSGTASASAPVLEGEGGQGRVSHILSLGGEDHCEQRAPKRVRTAGQVRAPPLHPQITDAASEDQCCQVSTSQREQSSAELLPSMLTAMLQHCKAGHTVQEQQQQEQGQQQTQPRATQLQRQQRTEASSTAVGRARSGRSLLDTIAQVAQQQMLHQHWSKAPNQERQQQLDIYQKRRRTSEEAGPGGMDDGLMDASYGAARMYRSTSANGGGILMRDLQNRALLTQQEHLQRPCAGDGNGRSRAAAAASSAQRGSAAAGPWGPQSSSAAGAGIQSTRPYDSSDADLSRAHVLPYKVSGSNAAAALAMGPPTQVLYGPVATGALDAGALGSAHEILYVSSLMDLLSRGGVGKAAALPQLQVEVGASKYRPNGVLGGVHQASGGGAGLVLMPVLDLGKPPTALAF